MGLVTIPMALLSIASLIGGAWLLAIGAWQLVLLGLAAFGLCTLLAPALERLVISIDDAAADALAKRGRRSANLIAAISGGLPMAVILTWEYACFHLLVSGPSEAPVVARWLWSYGVATGPWTLFAMRVSRFRRTLCGIRAYAGHLAYWLLSILILAAGAAPLPAAVSMILPAILPFMVGLLLAIADRDALRNVRV